MQRLKDATPAGVLLASGKLATELDRLPPANGTCFIRWRMEPASYVAGSGDVANPAVHFGLSGAGARAWFDSR